MIQSRDHRYHGRLLLDATDMKIVAGNNGTLLVKLAQLDLTLVITQGLLKKIGQDLSAKCLIEFFARHPIYLRPKPENVHRLILTPVQSESPAPMLAPEINLNFFAPWAIRSR